MGDEWLRSLKDAFGKALSTALLMISFFCATGAHAGPLDAECEQFLSWISIPPHPDVPVEQLRLAEGSYEVDNWLRKVAGAYLSAAQQPQNFSREPFDAHEKLVKAAYLTYAEGLNLLIDGKKENNLNSTKEGRSLIATTNDMLADERWDIDILCTIQE